MAAPPGAALETGGTSAERLEPDRVDVAPSRRRVAAKVAAGLA